MIPAQPGWRYLRRKLLRRGAVAIKLPYAHYMAQGVTCHGAFAFGRKAVMTVDGHMANLSPAFPCDCCGDAETRCYLISMGTRRAIAYCHDGFMLWRLCAACVLWFAGASAIMNQLMLSTVAGYDHHSV